MTKSILLSKQKINELKKQLKDLKASLSEQKAEQVKRGGAYDSWHETAAYGATQAALEAKVKELKRERDELQVRDQYVREGHAHALADLGRLREEVHIVSAQVGPGTGRCSICKQSFPLGTKIAIVCPSCAEGKSDGEG